jgi:uncharacterized protein YjbJ (UPF0337 family)
MQIASVLCGYAKDVIFSLFYRLRRNTMKRSTKDKAKGKLHEAKGKAKEITGKIMDNPELEAEGKGENIAGKVQEKIGQIEKGVER